MQSRTFPPPPPTPPLDDRWAAGRGARARASASACCALSMAATASSQRAVLTASANRAITTASLCALTAGSTEGKPIGNALAREASAGLRCETAGRARSGTSSAAAEAEPIRAVPVARTSHPELIAKARPFMWCSFHSANPRLQAARARVDARVDEEGAKAAQRKEWAFGTVKLPAGCDRQPVFFQILAASRAGSDAHRPAMATSERAAEKVCDSLHKRRNSAKCPDQSTRAAARGTRGARPSRTPLGVTTRPLSPRSACAIRRDNRRCAYPSTVAEYARSSARFRSS